MRPSTSYIDQTLYWTIPIYTSSGTLVDADNSPFPTALARIGDTSAGNGATITKRSGATGIYDCNYVTSGTAGTVYTFAELIYISGVPYHNSFSVTVISPERGTDGVTGFATTTQVNTINSNLSGLITAIDDNLATTVRLNQIESNLSGLVSNISGGGDTSNLATTAQLNTINSNLSGLILAVDDSLATSTRLNQVESNISGLFSTISLSGATISADVGLTQDALNDIGEILGGNSSYGLVHHIINANYKTTCK